jgi:hypothetical protein
MKHFMLIIAILLMFGSSLACCIMPHIPDIEINVPTIQVGEMQSTREQVPLAEAESATVEVLFAAGELDIEAGDPDQLFSGRFRYNVEEWEPTVTYEGDMLTIEQGGIKGDWGVPTGNTRNEWELEFSPDIPLEVKLDVGAGDGELDFTGLQLTELDVEMGAGNFDLRFDEPNEARMSRFDVDTGAAQLDVTGIGNAGPEHVVVNGGVGDIMLDFRGRWPGSASVDITAGVGSLTLYLPDDVGAQVEVEGGLTNVETDGLRRRDDAYVNDAFGEAEAELHIQVTTGIGSLRLLEVSND